MRAGRDKDDVYTHGHSTAVVSQHSSRTAEECAAFLFPFITGKERLLDCGCGPGSISCDLAERVDHVTALDREAKIVESAKALAVERGVSNVEIVVGDVYDLDFPDDSFDVAFANQVLQHLSDPVAALREMGRVVKPVGVVAVRDADYASMLGHPGIRSRESVGPGIRRWNDLYHAVARRNDAEPDAGRHLVSWARQAGFRLDQIRFTTSVKQYDHQNEGERRRWGRDWAARTMASSFGRQAVEYGLATREDLRSIADAWNDFAEDDACIFYYVNGEVVVSVA